MEPDIFERFDYFAKLIRNGDGVTAFNTDHLPDSLDWQGGRLWVVGGCIMLHEDGRDG